MKNFSCRQWQESTNARQRLASVGRDPVAAGSLDLLTAHCPRGEESIEQILEYPTTGVAQAAASLWALLRKEVTLEYMHLLRGADHLPLLPPVAKWSSRVAAQAVSDSP